MMISGPRAAGTEHPAPRVPLPRSPGRYATTHRLVRSIFAATQTSSVRVGTLDVLRTADVPVVPLTRRQYGSESPFHPGQSGIAGDLRVQERPGPTMGFKSKRGR